jgi:hypothetical protein
VFQVALGCPEGLGDLVLGLGAAQGVADKYRSAPLPEIEEWGISGFH